MSFFTFFLLVAQACLIQAVFGWECAPVAPIIAPIGPGLGYGAAGLGLGYGEAFHWGGVGSGNVAMNGELDVAGNTFVAGQIPVLGQVGFGGSIPATGAVTISGRCGYPCGCNNIYY